jgi:hypothetical protein
VGGEVLGDRSRHCERSEAIHCSDKKSLIASSLRSFAMTKPTKMGDQEMTTTEIDTGTNELLCAIRERVAIITAMHCPTI